MKRITTKALLCVVAVFAASALAASAASAALPEYKTCIKANPKNTGKFSSKTCSGPEAAGGKYELGEWNQGTSPKFTGKSKNPVNETVNPFNHKVEGAVTCKKEAVEGELTGPKTADIKSKWNKCVVLGTKIACQSAGAGSGEIIGDALKTTLIYLNSAHTKVGVLINPQSGEELAKYECAGGVVKIKATGSVIGEVLGDVNEAQKKNKTALRKGTGGDELQQFAYAAEAGNEANEQNFIEWASNLDEDPPATLPDVDPNLAEFEACVVEGATPTAFGGDEESVPNAQLKCLELSPAFAPEANDDNNEPGEAGTTKYFGYLGQNLGVPQPAFILSEAKGAGPGKESPAPATQVGETEDKGQQMMVKIS